MDVFHGKAGEIDGKMDYTGLFYEISFQKYSSEETARDFFRMVSGCICSSNTFVVENAGKNFSLYDVDRTNCLCKSK